MVRAVRRLSVIYGFTFVARPASILCETSPGKIGRAMKRPPYSVAGFVLALAARLISGAAPGRALPCESRLPSSCRQGADPARARVLRGVGLWTPPSLHHRRAPPPCRLRSLAVSSGIPGSGSARGDEHG